MNKEKKVIKEFIRDTPNWLEQVARQNEIAKTQKQYCLFCGINYKKIEELRNALIKLF